MTVNTTNITSGPYIGNGLLDTYEYDFRVTTEDQLLVYETDDAGVQTLLVLNTDYTVTAVGVDGGSTIVRTAGVLPVDYQWYIRSNYTENQLTDFASQGGFFPDVHEAQFDHITYLVQQLRDTLTRAFRFSDLIDNSGIDSTLPLPVADSVIAAWNPTADALVIGPTITDIANAQTNAADALASQIAAALSEAAAADSAAAAAGSAAAAANYGTRIAQVPLLATALDLTLLTGRLPAVTVGTTPLGVAFDGTHIWVVNNGANTVSKINIATDTVVATVTVGNSPYGVAFDGTHIWVANSTTNTVSKIDIATDTVVATVTVGTSPYGVAFDGTHIWVANLSSNTVSKIDINTNTVVATVTVGTTPYGVAFDGTHIWVVNNGASSVQKIVAR